MFTPDSSCFSSLARPSSDSRSGLDTPGLGNVKFWEVGTHELAWCFPEFRPYLGGCKFQDCSHEHEPDCAVIAALEGGELSGRRYESYVKFLGESSERGAGGT